MKIMNNIEVNKTTKIKDNSKSKKTKFKEILNMLYVDVIKTPFYILTHPIKGFEEFKNEGLRKRYVAIFYLVMMCVTQVIAYNGNGFLVNSNNPREFNALKIVLLVIIPVLLVSLGNLAFTTLFDGKGNLEEIFSVICYSFAPFVWIAIPNIIYSNFLITEEIGFYQAFNYIGIFLLVFMAFFGLMVIHEYGFLKSIITIVFTIVAIGIIIFVFFLILTIFQQVYSFIIAIYREFIMRYL